MTNIESIIGSLDSLEARLNAIAVKIGTMPATQKTAIATPDPLAMFNKRMATAAANGETVFMGYAH